MHDPARQRRSRRRFDDDEPTFAKRDRHRPALPSLDDLDVADGLPAGDRWSTWDQSAASERGPRPRPGWLITELAATDTELGILKTGKEADVFLLRRGVPGTDRSCLLAAKRYRSAEHRLFHRDSEYLEGRRVRDSRASRAMASRSAFGREVIAEQWAGAEFSALCQFSWLACPCPTRFRYSVPRSCSSSSERQTGRPRPGWPSAGCVAPTWPNCGRQLVRSMATLARLGVAHGDLSAYNLLVHGGRLVLIDTPQVVDVIANPRGAEFLNRDAANVGSWFAAHGLPRHGGEPGPDELAAYLRAEARLR